MADVFGVSLALVENVARQPRTTGNIAPKPYTSAQKPRLDAATQAVGPRLLWAHPEASLAELCTGVAAETDIRVRVPTMCRVLQRLG